MQAFNEVIFGHSPVSYKPHDVLHINFLLTEWEVHTERISNLGFDSEGRYFTSVSVVYMARSKLG